MDRAEPVVLRHQRHLRLSPERKISIAVVNTYGEGAFGEDGGYSNASVPLFEAIAAYLVPDLATPVARLAPVFANDDPGSVPRHEGSVFARLHLSSAQSWVETS